MKKQLEELAIFMARFLAKKECLINPEVSPYMKEVSLFNVDGYVFTTDKRVKGVVVFGNRYPLNGLDISIEDHLKVCKVIKNIKTYGVVFTSVGPKGESFQYLPKI